ncbi:hypothetical protein [Candidatus Phytoplasma sacchari]|uniref:Uncharacterized protein n=1 Tax=Candidatus Phytoplasma sacchari TaxID=2609813 RepID=A0ABY7M160_9MOLU|nr:hypothetical protein O7R10_00085 [Candidatus Phytoplasma sacchari]
MFFKKILNKKNNLWFFLLLIFFLVIIFYTIKKNKKENNNPYINNNLSLPKIEEIKKWKENNEEMIEINYYFDRLNGLGYYKEKLKQEENKNINNKDLSLISFYQHKINCQKEPDEMLKYELDKKPFKEWEIKTIFQKINIFDIIKLNKSEDSFLYDQIQKIDINHDNKSLSIMYKGQKKILENDKDYFICEVEISYVFWQQKYYLHFNPSRKTLSIYTEKFENKSYELK